MENGPRLTHSERYASCGAVSRAVSRWTSYREVLLDVLPVVGDAGRRDDRVPQDLEADLAAQVVGHVPLLQADAVPTVTAEL